MSTILLSLGTSVISRVARPVEEVLHLTQIGDGSMQTQVTITALRELSGTKTTVPTRRLAPGTAQ